MIYKPGGHREFKEIGAKAFELAKLSEAGFFVPPFFVLSVDLFHDFLAQKKEEFQTLLSSYQDENREKILSLIENGEFSKQSKERILDEIKTFFGEDCRISVRSSAVDEDGEQFSFAGMMESVLNVSTKEPEQIFDSIKKCYFSCFSQRAMTYRKENGLINENIAMAVILQKVVDADISGVMFTTNPKTNNPDEILISLVHGLGEGLVSGEKDSMDALYDRFGTKLECDESMPISDKVLDEIVELGLKIEDLDEKKRGRDIEFCVKDDKIHFLQNRLITTYRHIEKNKERTILDNSNIIESYSGVTTPLTFTFAREVYEKIYRQTLGNFFIDRADIESISEDLKNMILFFENKVYYRLNSWYKMTALYPGYNKNKRYMEEMMGVKVELKESQGQAKLRLIKIYISFFRKLLGMKKATDLFAKKYYEVTREYANNDFTGFDNLNLIRIYKELEEAILNDFTTPIVNDMGAMVFLGKLNDSVKKQGIKDAQGLIGKILSKQGNVESVKQSLYLMELVSEIWDDEELSSAFRSKPVEVLKEFLKGESPFSNHLRDYIACYGARVMDELKLESVTLRENSDFLFQTLKNYLQMQEKPTVYQPLEIDEGEIYRQIPLIKRFFFRKLVNITKYFVRNREFLRLFRTYIYDIVRSIFLRIGHNLEAQGVILHYRDIFFLTKEEIFGICEGEKIPQEILMRRISNRKKEYEENKEKEIFERMYFYGEVKRENMIPIFSRQESEEFSEEVLRGVAGGGNPVTGKVKFVENPMNADVEGFILMAKRTDPGWSVLFPMAKAIIIERGSVLSHSAVIAREMGIPLVVGIRGLTQRVKDGMTVRVDGVKGIVEIIEENDENESYFYRDFSVYRRENE